MNHGAQSKHRLAALLAARLAVAGKTQIEIATELSRRLQRHVSQPDISRWLGRAEKVHGFFNPRPSMVRHKVSDEELARAERLLAGNPHLEKVVKGWRPDLAPEVQVVSGQDEDTFFREGAAILANYLEHSQTIGVMWGRTVHELFDRLGMVVEPRDREVQCIPLCGEPGFVINQEGQLFSASRLAEELERSLTHKPKDTPSLLGVPAYVRSDLAQQDGPSSIMEYFRGYPGYRRIFRGADALVDKVDTLITSVGVIVGEDRMMGTFLKERLEQEPTRPKGGGLNEQALNDLVLGDIGGFLVERPELGPRKQKRVEELNRGWTGLRGEDLRRIAEKARKNKTPGVIVIAYVEAKHELLRECIQRGYVNQVLVSEALSRRWLE